MKNSENPSILFLTCGFPPEQVGGVEQHTLEICRVLRKRGLGVGIYTRGEREDLDEYSTYHGEFDGFPVTRVVYRWSSAHSLRHIYDDEQLSVVFSRFLERTKPKLVHVHHLSGLSCGCLKVIKEAGIPLVMTLHDYWMICPRGQMFHADLYSCNQVSSSGCTPCIAATWPGLVPSGGGLPFAPDLPREDQESVGALQAWLKEVLTFPNLLLTPSAAARNKFLESGIKPGQIRVMENGLDTKPFLNVVRESSNRIRIGYVGTLLPSKGAHILVEAFLRLPPGSASLTLAGNAPAMYQCTDYLDRIKSLMEKSSMENPIELNGSYNHEDLPSILAKIDILVVPPLWEETFGLTLREGLLAGCAVVCSRIGGMPQAVEEGKNGFIFPPGDVDALSGLLMRFVQDRGLAAKMGSHERAVRTVEDMVENLLSCYDEVGYL